jgi:hypothetical protein
VKEGVTSSNRDFMASGESKARKQTVSSPGIGEHTSEHQNSAWNVLDEQYREKRPPYDILDGVDQWHRTYSIYSRHV